jgi:hypothetical protein
MADRWYNVALGKNMREDVAEGGSDTSLYVGVRVTYDASGNSKRAAIDALEAVKQAILRDTWPPV